MSDFTEYRKQLAVEYDQLYDATEETLDEWDKTNSDKNFKFPELLEKLSLKFNWDDKLSRENDPLIRKYIRNHPKWYITRGAFGGIMRRADWEKKNSVKVAKEAEKQKMQAALLAKEAAAKATTSKVETSEESEVLDEEDSE